VTERKNLKITQESYDLLKARKSDYETWDGVIHRLCGESMLTCHECGSDNIVSEDMGPTGTAIRCGDCDETIQVG